MTVTRPASSLRARVVRAGFVLALRAMRELGAGGLPDPDAPRRELEAYALRMRATMESVLGRIPVGRDIEVLPLTGAAVPGLVVLPAELRPALADIADPREWLAQVERVVVHLHGGAYALGSPRTHRTIAASIARTARAAVVLPDYRLSPEHPFPAALEDAEATWRWLLDVAGVHPWRVGISGDSAGGGLAAALLVRLLAEGVPHPACYLGWSPWLDLAATGDSIRDRAGADPWLPAPLLLPAALAYAGDTPLTDPEVSPLYAPLAGFPPTLLHVGGDDILLDDARRFVARARAAGVDASVGVFPGLWHVFPAFPGLPESRDTIAEAGAFLRRHLDP
ncbi:MAG: alpha/beta hydrolase fold domain-containing protein [Nitriliruptoraceae bacterium]